MRIGGNSQDYALYNQSLPAAVYGTYDRDKTINYPAHVQIGPSFFESYSTWPNVKFTHGFNLGLATTPEGWQSLLDTVPLACTALEGDKLLGWEYGNEPDLYPTNIDRSLRIAANWNSSTYVDQWKNGTAAIKELIDLHCPNMTTYGYVGPSLAGLHLNPRKIFQDGYNSDGQIKQITLHK